MLLSLFGFILFGMGPADFAEFRLKSNHQFINRLQTLIVISDGVNKARPTFSMRSSFTRNRILFTFHRSRSWRRYIDAVIHGGGLETRSVRKFRLWFELLSIAPKCEEKQKHMNNTEINTQQMPHYPKFRCGSDTRGNQLLISFGFWHLEFVLFLLYLLCQFHHQFAYIFFFGCKLSRLFILNWIQMRQTILPSVQWIGKKYQWIGNLYIDTNHTNRIWFGIRLIAKNGWNHLELSIGVNCTVCKFKQKFSILHFEACSFIDESIVSSYLWFSHIWMSIHSRLFSGKFICYSIYG